MTDCASSLHDQTSPGGVFLVYLSDGDVPFFRISFSPIFFHYRVSKEGKFSGAGCQKRKFCYNGLLFSQIFVFFFSILFSDFFWNRVSFDGKNSGAG